jgi:hypothetical protein
VVARAFDEKLLWSDLRQVIPIQVTGQDSAALAGQYIGNWLRQQAVLHQAEQNLSAGAKDFEIQLRDYRRSLVIYTYEQALIQQKLDTVVHVEEMEDHLARNGANFELREPILRVRYAKAREEDKRIARRLEEHFLNGSTERMHELEMWMAQRGLSFVDHGQRWMNEQTLLAEMSVGAPLPPNLLDRTGRVVHREDGQLYFIEVLEYRSAGEVAPLERVADEIRSIIINQRKLQLLERMREDLYREALEQQHIEAL